MIWRRGRPQVDLKENSALRQLFEARRRRAWQRRRQAAVKVLLAVLGLAVLFKLGEATKPELSTLPTAPPSWQIPKQPEEPILPLEPSSAPVQPGQPIPQKAERLSREQVQVLLELLSSFAMQIKERGASSSPVVSGIPESAPSRVRKTPAPSSGGEIILSSGQPIPLPPQVPPDGLAEAARAFKRLSSLVTSWQESIVPAILSDLKSQMMWQMSQSGRKNFTKVYRETDLEVLGTHHLPSDLVQYMPEGVKIRIRPEEILASGVVVLNGEKVPLEVRIRPVVHAGALEMSIQGVDVDGLPLPATLLQVMESQSVVTSGSGSSHLEVKHLELQDGWMAVTVDLT